MQCLIIPNSVGLMWSDGRNRTAAMDAVRGGNKCLGSGETSLAQTTSPHGSARRPAWHGSALMRLVWPADLSFEGMSSGALYSLIWRTGVVIDRIGRVTLPMQPLPSPSLSFLCASHPSRRLCDNPPDGRLGTDASYWSFSCLLPLG